MTVTTRRIATVTAAAAVLLLLAWYGALYRPESAHLRSAHHAYSVAQQHVAQLEAQVSSLKALERDIPADTARLAVLDGDVPTTPDLKDLLDQLHALATGTGCQLTTVSPSIGPSGSSASASGAAAGGLAEVRLSMVASGDYGQVTSFLSGLTTLARTMVIDSTSVTPGAGGTIGVTVSARAFYAQ